jgi:hypothetical protein
LAPAVARERPAPPRVSRRQTTPARTAAPAPAKKIWNPDSIFLP